MEGHYNMDLICYKRHYFEKEDVSPIEQELYIFQIVSSCLTLI